MTLIADMLRAIVRRKANGKVAEDYEKAKAKKKAAMDAKKNALRSEDIAKGVFVPVSAMPKKEPKKAEGSKTILPMAANQ